MSVVPKPGNTSIDWEIIWMLLPGMDEAMSSTPQDARHHGEGDVLTHTKMVVDALVRDPEWQSLPIERRALLFWSCVLHDSGKPHTTVTEDDGSITSKGHSRAGASIARSILWHAHTPIEWREQLCGLIAYHQVPFWLIEREDADRQAYGISYSCIPQELIIHARADANGRLCADKTDLLDKVELAGVIFKEGNCYTQPRPFANEGSKVEYFANTDRAADYAVYEDYKSKVTMMCGLPGTGKDTWISKHASGLAVVCMDEIRIELGIKPTDNQGRVIQEAKERARVLLRRGEDFVWNSTNLNRQRRTQLLSLFLSYGAHTTVVYIETDPSTHRKRNAKRADAVPDREVDAMIGRLELPLPTESHMLITCQW